MRWSSRRFGPDRGCDIPLADRVHAQPEAAAQRYGNDPRLTLVLFTLDETTYSRELAPLAGHYPAFGWARRGGSTTASRA